MRAKASAAAPAKPTSTWPSISLRLLTAALLTTVWPMVTCPSPPMATRPLWRTVRMVVERIFMASGAWALIRCAAAMALLLVIVQRLVDRTRGDNGLGDVRCRGLVGG